jgi:hypothetical protein
VIFPRALAVRQDRIKDLRPQKTIYICWSYA